ncbi:ABC transporter substrate-binding protein [Pseudothermotoga thermarum]|uniref:Probable sugar-binding periplasmic protein n=1 Tax=Pseudothermotoga thermarum DSM 5069 TaxID=688269 RepID=F7YUY8_9THEM|nr:extracellular solute-binding protein [Pseudothermotoga thermarum]AEH51554.1 carbohydrate ABC transporter substrate-binding protein, CUT1 family [Pseudothermotoga thermarum DSM 5069]
MVKRLLVVLLALVVTLAVASKLEVFSWWTAGGEAEGLQELFNIYSKLYPGVEIINATVAGGAGAQAKAVLKTRMLGGDPPDTFQVHAGRELIDTWVKTGFMEPLTELFISEGWTKVMPKGILDIISYNGEYWSVPVNIHRANVLWYNKTIFEKYGLKPPKTFDEFFDVAEKLKAKGIIPLAFGTKDGWEAAHVFETVLIGTLGAEGYRGLWTGKTKWSDPRVTQALEIFAKMLKYVNPDHAARTWDEACALIVEGKAAMNIMGDWAAGYFMAKGFEDFGWTLAPNNEGIFDALSDSFGLPKGAKNRENVIAFLKVLGSKEGQEAFNIKKGSIPARTDVNKDLFPAYQKSAMEDWLKHEIVPSVMHGAAAPESWVTEFKDVIALFVARPDVKTTQKALISIARLHGMPE